MRLYKGRPEVLEGREEREKRVYDFLDGLGIVYESIDHEKAETMEDIISLETALSDVEYEIEQLSSTLNRYDSLVSFATIRLDL